MKMAVSAFLRVGGMMLVLALTGCAAVLPLSWYQKTSEYSLDPKAHARLAAAYRKEAVQLRKRAAFHQAMAEQVRANPSWSGPRERDEWLAHCESLSKKYLEAAKAADELAEEHEGHAEVLEGVRELRR